jgi:threonine synthase
LPTPSPRYGFVSGRSTHADRLATIRAPGSRHGVMIDTHTADGVKVAREHLQPGVPMLVLETALPIKFAATIVEALGRPTGPAHEICRHRGAAQARDGDGRPMRRLFKGLHRRERRLSA